MDIELQALITAVERADIEEFVEIISRGQLLYRGSVEFTVLTQQILPPLLCSWLSSEKASASHILALWSLIRNGKLLVVDNAVLEAINSRLAESWVAVHGPLLPMPEKLATFEDEVVPHQAPPNSENVPPEHVDFPMRRIVLRTSFLVGLAHASEKIEPKKNLCASSQEREFLKAIRLFFPTVRAYPNVPLRNFMEIALMTAINERQHNYAKWAVVDVLLCTEDEDPIAGFELDSSLHDSDVVKERDQRKNELFALARIPLMRIRAEDTQNVRAEDFFELLVAESKRLDKLRPRRMRPRRNHDLLIPD